MSSLQELFYLVDEFTHGLCEPLALQLHIKTGKPTYSIYDPTEKPCVWGIDYFHSFIKIEENLFLNARGLHTKEQMIAFWADAWKNEDLINNAKIVPREIVLKATGYVDIDMAITARYGDPTRIQSHTVEFADMLLGAYDIPTL